MGVLLTRRGHLLAALFVATLAGCTKSVRTETLLECAEFDGDKYLAVPSSVTCSSVADKVNAMIGECTGTAGELACITVGSMTLLLSNSIDSCLNSAAGLNNAHHVTQFYKKGTFSCSGDLLLTDTERGCAAPAAILNAALAHREAGTMTECDVTSPSTTKRISQVVVIRPSNRSCSERLCCVAALSVCDLKQIFVVRERTLSANHFPVCVRRTRLEQLVQHIFLRIALCI